MGAQDAAIREQVATQPAAKERRRSHRSDPEFQNRFRLTILKLIAIALTPITLLSLSVAHAVKHPAVFLDSLWVPIGLTVTGLVASALIVGLCDRVSNRYCGPTFRMIKTLEAIRRGERPGPIRTRQDDEFAPLVEELNQTLAKLGVIDDSHG